MKILTDVTYSQLIKECVKEGKTNLSTFDASTKSNLVFRYILENDGITSGDIAYMFQIALAAGSVYDGESDHSTCINKLYKVIMHKINSGIQHDIDEENNNMRWIALSEKLEENTRFIDELR